MASGPTTYEGSNPWGLFSKQQAILMMSFQVALPQYLAGGTPDYGSVVAAAIDFYDNAYGLILAEPL